MGWCGIAPRETLAALENSRILKRVDDKPVWSITCFFVAKEVRRTGIMESLIKAAVAHAKSNGAQIVEAYPIDMQSPAGTDVQQLQWLYGCGIVVSGPRVRKCGTGIRDTVDHALVYWEFQKGKVK